MTQEVWGCPISSHINVLSSALRSRETRDLMATGGENFNPAYEAFRKHSADLLTVIQDPEVLAWELYAENIIPPAVRDAAAYMMYEKGARTSNLLIAVESQIKVDPGMFDVFLSVLAKRPAMSDLCGRMKEACGK